MGCVIMERCDYHAMTRSSGLVMIFGGLQTE